MSEKKTWQPHIDSEQPFNASPNVLDRPDPHALDIHDAEEDTAPLQGTHDLSDPDSLEDVIADAYRPKDFPKTEEK